MKASGVESFVALNLETESTQMVADGTPSKTVQKVASGTAAKRDITILKKALDRAEKEYKNHGEIVTGIFAGEDIKRVRHLKGALADMEREHLKFSTRVKNISKKTGLLIRVGIVPAVNSLKLAFKGVGVAATAAGKAISAAMKARKYAQKLTKNNLLRWAI